MAELIQLFPLILYKDKLNLKKEEKDKLINKIIDMEKNSMEDLKNNLEKKDGTSWLGDVHGFDNLHMQEEFNNLYELIMSHIKKYMEGFSLNINKLDIYIQRSWATVSRGKESIGSHKHSQSNISFAYYLKKEEEDSKITFFDTAKQNEFIPEIFNSRSINNEKIVKIRNLMNSPDISIKVKEDELVIFPSKAAHGTEAKIYNKERISISADISITAKDSKNLEHLVPPFNNWKKY